MSKADIGLMDDGHYYQLLDKNENPIGPITGPYVSFADAKKAAQEAIDKHDGWQDWPIGSTAH